MKGESRLLSRLAKFSDDFNEQLGRFVSWLVLLVVLVGAFNALVRYTGRYTGVYLSSNALLETQWYLFSLVFLLGAAYTLRHDGHVRVDVLYQRLTPRKQAWINLLGTLFFLIPFAVLMIWASWFPVRNSWLVREMSPDPGGLARYPIKTAIPIAFLLVLAQACVQAARHARFLCRHPPAEPPL